MIHIQFIINLIMIFLLVMESNGTVGDSWDRYYVRVLEMEESCKIIEQALDQLPEGDVNFCNSKKN